MAQDTLRDLVLVNGKVVTMDPDDRVAEAVAVAGGRIAAVGTNVEIRRRASRKTRVLDAGGKTVLPGLIDSHSHLEATAVHLTHMARIHSPPVTSVADMVARMAAWAEKLPPGEWAIGRGSFAQVHKLAEGRLPTRQELDDAIPDRPAMTIHSSHLNVVNTVGLEALGVTPEATDLGHGTMVERDPATGESTGVVLEAFRLVPWKRPGREQLKADLVETIRDMYIGQGITTVHEIPASNTGVSLYQELMEEGRLPIRVTLYPVVPRQVEMEGLIKLGFRSGFGNERLRLGGVKMFADGGIAAPAAALYDAYPGRPGYYGLLQMTQEEMTERVTALHQAGLQLWVHANGEKAQDMVLDAIEHALEVAPRADHRHRLEHSANLFGTPERIARYKELGATPAANSQFIHAVGFALRRYYGEKARVAFPYRTLLAAGLKVPNGSDSTGTQPEGTNPFWGIWCCVARRSFDGSLVSPEEGISVMDALRMFTTNAAWGAFEEKMKGSIEVGKLADMIVTSEDPLTVPVERIKNIRVEKTIVGGEVVHGR